MFVVREAIEDEWQILRSVRLAALQDAPDAFLATYSDQAALQEGDWRYTISRGGTFLAYSSKDDAAVPTGLVCGELEKSGVVQLMSMWVHPHNRGCGVGEALVAAVVNWANNRSAKSIHLWVMETNKHARILYDRCGFSPTGERQPLPSDRNLIEIGMTCML